MSVLPAEAAVTTRRNGQKRPAFHLRLPAIDALGSTSAIDAGERPVERVPDLPAVAPAVVPPGDGASAVADPLPVESNPAPPSVEAEPKRDPRAIIPLPNGVQILNRILSRSTHPPKPRRRLRRWQKRLAVAAVCLTCLFGLTLAFGLNFTDDLAIEVSEPDDASDAGVALDFSSPSSSARPAVGGGRPRLNGSGTVPAAGEQAGSTVESALYQTTRSNSDNGVWIDGIEDSDER